MSRRNLVPAAVGALLALVITLLVVMATGGHITWDRTPVSVAAPSVSPSPTLTPKTTTPAPEPLVPGLTPFAERRLPTEADLQTVGFIPTKVSVMGLEMAHAVSANMLLMPLQDSVNDHLRKPFTYVPNSGTNAWLADSPLDFALSATTLNAWANPKVKGLMVYTDPTSAKAVMLTYTRGDSQPMLYLGITDATASELAGPALESQLKALVSIGLEMGGSANTVSPDADGFIGAADLA